MKPQQPSSLPAAVILCAALLPLPVLAAGTAAHDHDHGQTPATTSSPAASTPSPAASTSDPYDDQIKRMQDVHEKMLAAKTPAERQKLSAEGMKLMQESMTMMKDMRSGDMGMMGQDEMPQGDQAGMMDMAQCMHMHKTMMKQMHMMQLMMQLMIDQRLAAPAK